MGPDEQSFRERVEEILQERSRDQTQIPDHIEDELSEYVGKAKKESVTIGRLVGNETYFYNILPFFEEDEQAHYACTYKGITAKPALEVEAGAEREELISKLDGGSVVVTVRYVRIQNDTGEWSIPFDSITSVDFVGHPGFHIQTPGRTYYIRLAGTQLDQSDDASEAACFIRKQQRERSVESKSSSGPQQIRELKELQEDGLIPRWSLKIKKGNLGQHLTVILQAIGVNCPAVLHDI